jgi:hypothetical protein
MGRENEELTCMANECLDHCWSDCSSHCSCIKNHLAAFPWPLCTKRQLGIKYEESCALWPSKELSRQGEQEEALYAGHCDQEITRSPRDAPRAAIPNERRTSPCHLTSSS